MKVLSLTIILCLSLPHLIYSQTGLKFGLNRSNFAQDNLDNTSYNGVLNFQVGITTKMKTFESGFRAEFLYSVKGAEFKSTQTAEFENYSQTYEVTQVDRIPYFDMPLLFTFAIYKSLIIETGPNFAVRLGGKRSIKRKQSYHFPLTGTQLEHDYSEVTYKYSDEEVFSNTRDTQYETEPNLSKNLIKRYDIGLNIGIQFFLTNKISVVGRYNYGILDVINDQYFNLSTQRSNYEGNRNLELALSFYLGG